MIAMWSYCGAEHRAVNSGPPPPVQMNATNCIQMTPQEMTAMFHEARSRSTSPDRGQFPARHPHAPSGSVSVQSESSGLIQHTVVTEEQVTVEFTAHSSSAEISGSSASEAANLSAIRSDSNFTCYPITFSTEQDANDFLNVAKVGWGAESFLVFVPEIESYWRLAFGNLPEKFFKSPENESRVVPH